MKLPLHMTGPSKRNEALAMTGHNTSAVRPKAALCMVPGCHPPHRLSQCCAWHGAWPTKRLEEPAEA
eukprot:2598950-Lingulodinium_polyedra.AAC.1